MIYYFLNNLFHLSYRVYHPHLEFILIKLVEISFLFVLILSSLFLST